MEILGLTFAALALVVLLAVVIPAALVWLAIRIVGLVFRVLGLRTAEPAPSGGRQGRIAMWAQRTVADLGNLVGSVIACVGLGLFSLARLLTLSPRASRVLFDSSSQELLAAVAALYRIALGHPLGSPFTNVFAQGAMGPHGPNIIKEPKTNHENTSRPY